MKNKLSNNYSVFSEYRGMLMGMATIMIAIFHLVFFANSFMHKHNLYDATAVLNVGVEIFLFLSGIGLYFAYSKKPKFSEYYTKRIINVYFIFLIINLGFVLFLTSKFHYSPSHFFLRWTGISYWIKNYNAAYGNESKPGWYVIYAMMLYLLYPLIYKVQCWLKSKKLDLIALCVFITLWVIFCVEFDKINNDLFFHIEIGMNRIPIFLIGSYCGSKVYNKDKLDLPIYLAGIAGIGIKIWYFMSDYKPLIFGRLSQCLFSISIILIIIFIFDMLKLPHIKALFEHFGTMSLEFYLTHNMLRIIFGLIGLNRLRHYALLLIISYILSLIISRFRAFIVKKYTLYLKSKKAD